MRLHPRHTGETSQAKSTCQSAVRDLTHDPNEMDHFVRALSHDMSANFMVLEDSLRRLKRSQQRNPLADLAENFAHVEACLRESKRFLDDLVLLGKTGSVDMQAELLELGPLVREVIFEQRALLDERRIRVVVAERLPAVWCNEVRLRQVFTNLIRNAAHHGCDARAPRIEVSQVAHAPENDESFVWLRVYDNGRGIPASARDEIFLPGKRLHGAHESGTGMGLAIVRKVVLHFGGTVLVDPTCEVGTAFLFSLPTRASASTEVIGVRPQTHDSSRLNRPHHRRRLHEGRRE